MATTTKLLDLPNELLEIIFGYLSSTDLVHAFVQIHSKRLKPLILPLVQRLNLIDCGVTWIQQYLPLAYTVYGSFSVHVRDQQLESILPSLLDSKITSVEICSATITDLIVQNKSIKQLAQHVKNLSIDFNGMEEDAKLVPILFTQHSNLEYLAIRNCTLYFDESMVRSSQYLKSLHIEIEGIHHLFILLKHLQLLEKLSVRFISNECIVQPDPVVEDSRPCSRLQNVNLTGHIRQFSHFGLFFAIFGSTFEHVRVSITPLWLDIDGNILENELLIYMPLLKSLTLFITSRLDDEKTRCVDTFQTERWEHLSPIIDYVDTDACEHVICTISHENKQMSLSNSGILSWYCNHPSNQHLLHVQTLVYNVTSPVTFHSWKFINQMFPNLRQLKFIYSMANFGEGEEEDSDDHDNNAKIKINQVHLMADCLLHDQMVVLPTVRHVCIDFRMISIESITFYRLFQLLPNLVHLKFHQAQTSTFTEWVVDSNDSSLQQKLSHVRLVEAVLVHRRQELQLQKYLSRLFPNAKVNAKINPYAWDSSEDNDDDAN